MIPNQRDLFDIPEDVAYLNCAYTSPLLKEAVEAGHGALLEKTRPWGLLAQAFFDRANAARNAFARLVGAGDDDVAIIPSVSYGAALAAANLPVGPGRRIVVLAEQFPSHVYSWRRLAAQVGAEIITVKSPADGDWTPGVLEAIDERAAVAALPPCHWTDGSLVDLVQVGEKCRQFGVALAVDGTQSLGAMPFSVAEVRPDFLFATSHKWLLGAYSLGFCYVAPRWQSGRPLEENWLNRAGSENFAALVDYRDGYQPGARRFDMGEASNFILAPIATTAIERLLAWGVDRIATTLKGMTDEIASRAEALGLKCARPGARSPHMIGVSRPGGFDPDLPRRLVAGKVFVSFRGSAIRISPHLYNTREDLDRLFRVLEETL